MVKVPGGWTRMGDIQMGQMVTTPDGGSAPVVGIYPQGEIPCYRVHFEDGRWTDCSLDHLWRVHYKHWGADGRVISLKQIMDYMENTPSKKNIMYIQLTEPEIMDDVLLQSRPVQTGQPHDRRIEARRNDLLQPSTVFAVGVQAQRWSR